MSPLTITLMVITIIILAAVVALYFFGKRMEKKQAEQKTMMDSMSQSVSMLIIDKKKMKLKESGLPKVVYEQTPKYLRWSKVPVVKAKVGPRVMSLMCDASVFDKVPVKQEVKATISGIYITDVKGVRGAVLQAPAKKKLMQRAKDKLFELAGKGQDNNKNSKKGSTKKK